MKSWPRTFLFRGWLLEEDTANQPAEDGSQARLKEYDALTWILVGFGRLALFVLVASLLYRCGPKRDKVERTTENGVEVVVNHLEPYVIPGEPSTLQLEEALTIDTEKSEVADKGLTSIYSFAVDGEGDIYISQRPRYGPVIFEFEREGRFLASFGRQGQGPGEFEGGTVIHIDEEDHVVAKDITRRKVSIFDKQGNLLRDEKLEKDVDPVQYLANKKYLVWWQVQDLEHGLIRNYFGIADGALRNVKEFHRYEFDDPGQAPRYNGYAGGFALGASNSRIFFGDSNQGYDILVLDFNGKLIKKIRKAFRPLPVPEQYKILVKKFFESRGDRGQMMLKKLYWPPHLPPFRYLFTDSQERLYVMTNEREGERHYWYDVFTKDGIFVSRIKLDNIRVNYYQDQRYNDSTLDVMVKGDRLYCLSEKDSGYTALTVYKMRWI
jgi:hypothetical protein